MRRPRDLDKYTSAAEGAWFLREVAKEIEEMSEGTLVKIDVNIRRWKTEWEKETRERRRR